MYCLGKGNNLHEVDCADGSKILVSMPKKYRQTVWLKKDDCLVIDPIEEGKKVKGEIVCVLPFDTVRDLIINRQWPSKSELKKSVDVDELVEFFTSATQHAKSDRNNDLESMYPPSDSSELETDEEDENVDDEDKGDQEDEESDINDPEK